MRKLKKNIFPNLSILLTLLLVLNISSNLYSQNSALSVHLTANDNFEGDIIMKTMKIPHKTLFTYYCALSWNIGGEAGGYCGMQNHPNGNNFIFSIWDPLSTNEPIRAAYIGEGTEVENFGGEGTGLKSWNFGLGWAEGHDYQLVARCWNVGNHTHFGYWVNDFSSNNWSHLVTMDFPVNNIKFNTGTNSFLEDWMSTGQNMRKVYHKDAYKRKTDKSWYPFNSSYFSINTFDIIAGNRSYNYKDNYDAGVEDGYYFMKSGDTTKPSFSGTGINLTNNFLPTPQMRSIKFGFTEVSDTIIAWTVPQSSTPQFKIKVVMSGITVIDTVAPNLREFNISGQSGNLILFSIEDLFGNTVQKTIYKNNTDLVPNIPTGLKLVDFNSSSFIINWDSVNSAQKYIVQIKENFIWKTIDSTESTEYTFTGLEQRTKYNARINAINQFGESAYSKSIFALTGVSNETIIPNEGWSLQFVDSEETIGEDGAATNAFDGDEKTFWHTAWSSSSPTHPHEIQLHLGEKYKLKGFKYLPRQDGGINGTIKDYEFYVSSDGVDWGNPLSVGSFDYSTEIKEIDLSETECEYVRFVALSELNGENWSSMAELILVGDLVVEVENDHKEIPNKFDLNSPFPNPFNPSTTILFSLPKETKVKISIFNSIGMLMETVVNKEQKAGIYKINFDASKYASGVYYCKMETPEFFKTQKMVLLK